MKNKTTFIVDVICVFLLITGTFQCLASSFAIHMDSFVTGFSALVFTLVFSLLSALVKNNAKFAASIAVSAGVFIATALACLNAILNHLACALNSILSVYSQYIDVPDRVRFGNENAGDATVVFVFLSVLLSLIFSVTLVRGRTILPCTVLSILTLIPCFVLVNTLPSVIWLAVVLAVLFTLFATSTVRRRNPAQSGFAVLGVSVFMFLLIITVFSVIPYEGYERAEWQDNMLKSIQELTGIQSSSRSNDSLDSELTAVRDNFSEFKNLSALGPMKQTNDVVFNVKSTRDAAVYLKGMAYANYKDNSWSTLSESQTKAFPDNYTPFGQTRINGKSNETLTISADKYQEMIFSPYFTTSFPKTCSPLGDVCVKNNTPSVMDESANTYQLLYYPYNGDMAANEGLYYCEKNEKTAAYTEYVYETYLDVPDNVKSGILKIAEENGLTGLETEDIPDKVQHFISNSAEYSLDTPKVPPGKDFTLWFFEESGTGYCVHFATAATLTLRSLGVPARYVTGYYANVDSDYQTPVTSGNAHAWTEYYDENVGWIPIDATPTAFISSAAVTSATVPATEAVPPTTQAETAETTAQPTTSAQSVSKVGGTNAPSDSAEKEESPSAVTAVLIIILIIAAAVIAVFARRFFILKSRAKKFGKGRNTEKAVQIYRYILLLSRYSHVVIPDEISEIAQRAKFSLHTVGNEEIALMKSFADSAAEEFTGTLSGVKKLYFKYIVILK